MLTYPPLPIRPSTGIGHDGRPAHFLCPVCGIGLSETDVAPRGDYRCPDCLTPTKPLERNPDSEGLTPWIP